MKVCTCPGCLTTDDIEQTPKKKLLGLIEVWNTSINQSIKKVWYLNKTCKEYIRVVQDRNFVRDLLQNVIHNIGDHIYPWCFKAHFFNCSVCCWSSSECTTTVWYCDNIVHFELESTRLESHWVHYVLDEVFPYYVWIYVKNLQFLETSRGHLLL